MGQCQHSDKKLMSNTPFFGSDNSGNTRFGSKSDSNNKNIKNVGPEFKIQTKIHDLQFF